MQADIPVAQRNALIDLYNSTNGAEWANKTNWLGAAGTECTWFGVTCDGSSSYVYSIDLRSNSLRGTLPSSIADLGNLAVLVLEGNQIGGSLPAEIGSISTLKYLNLSDNQLTGTIPAQLGDLTNLQLLYLPVNELSGSIPAALGSLTNLQYLSLSKNRLEGSIPAQIGNLSNLISLWLDGNQLEGALPVELMNLTNLGSRQLGLGWNALYSADSPLTDFLNSKHYFGDWRATQTVAPKNVTIAEAAPTSVTISWSLVAYQTDTGYYRVSYATTPGGPYVPFTTTTIGKFSSSLVVTGLAPRTTYYFIVQTVTLPHVNNANTLTSPASMEVSATTPIATRVALPAAHMPASGNVFTTDVTIQNLGGGDNRCAMKLFSQGSAPIASPEVIVGEAEGNRLIRDVVQTVFGMDAAAGGLVVECDGPALIRSRLFSSAGEVDTAGHGRTSMGRTENELPSEADRAIVLGVAEDSAYRTNLWLINSGTTDAIVRLVARDLTGAEAGSLTVPVPQQQFIQITRVLTQMGVTAARATIAAQVMTANAGPLYGGATLIDNTTQDSADLAFIAVKSGGGISPILTEGMTETALDIANWSPAAANIRAILALPDNTTIVRELTFAAYESRSIENVLSTLFGLSTGGIGILRLESDAAGFAAQTRLVTTYGAPGTYIEAAPAHRGPASAVLLRGAAGPLTNGMEIVAGSYGPITAGFTPPAGTSPSFATTVSGSSSANSSARATAPPGTSFENGSSLGEAVVFGRFLLGFALERRSSADAVAVMPLGVSQVPRPVIVDATVCPATSYELSAMPSASGATRTWYRDGMLLPDTTQQLTASVDGTYSVAMLYGEFTAAGRSRDVAVSLAALCPVKGDVDGDRQVGVSDVFYLITSLFAGGPAPAGSGDANGDGQVGIADLFYLINYLFAGGPAPV